VKRSEAFQNLAVGLLVVCALSVTGLVARRELAPSTARGSPSASVLQIDSEIAQELTARGHEVGPKGARLKIVEFVDLQCPFCAIVEDALRSALRPFGDSVAVVVRHFPLQTIHPHAWAAALAAECAAAEGKFEPFVRAAYASQDSLGILDWGELGRRAGVARADRFVDCVDEARFADRIREDMAAATRAGVRGTPTFVVGRSMFMGDPSQPVFGELIRESLGSTSGR
jgi:protein-disulfide isomerase